MMNFGLLFSGISLVIISFFLFMIDARKKEDTTVKKDLEKANSDVEYLLDELNTMSSLIVDEMDKRHSKMLDMYSEFEHLLTLACKDNHQQEPVIKPATGNKRDGVLELSEKGLTASQIARNMGIGTGEVELILRLANRGADTYD